MPLVRIITTHPRDAAALAEELRKRGYTVEVVRPGESCAGVADLEIRGEECAAADAVTRALQMAKDVGAEKIFVSGNIFAGADSSTANRRPSPAAGLALGAGARRSSVSLWIKERVRLLSRRKPEIPQESGPDVVGARSVFSTRIDPGTAARSAAPETPGAPEPVQQPGHAAVFPAQPMDAQCSAVDEDLKAREHLAFLLQIEAERQRQEAEERSRLAAVVQERRLREEQQHRLPRAAPPAPVTGIQAERRQAHPRPKTQLGRREREWRLAFAVAASFAVLLMMGWSFVTRPRSAAPMAPTEPDPAIATQQMPFRAAPLAPLPTQVQGSSSRPGAAVAEAQPPRSSSAPAKTAPKRHRSTSNWSEDEVIVRHYVTPSKKTGTEAKAAIKRYSDWE